MGDGAGSMPVCAFARCRRRVWTESCWSMWRAGGERVAQGVGKGYWQAEPCGTTRRPRRNQGRASSTTRSSAAVRAASRSSEASQQFEHWRGKRVLEVGVGLGTDFVQFARAGAEPTGVDLTEASVEAVRQRLALEGLDAELTVADAEALPFGDG